MSRTVALDDLGDITAPVGTEGWASAIRVTIQTRSHDWQSQRDSVLRMIDLLNRHRGWALLRRPDGSPFASLDEFICEREPYGLGYDEQRARVILRAEEPEPIHDSGRPAKGDANNLFTGHRGGSGAVYLTARIARDRPDILERMKAGEFRSVRAAAIEAGIITPEPELRVPRAVPKLAKALRRRLSRDELAALIVALGEQGCELGSSSQATSNPKS